MKSLPRFDAQSVRHARVSRAFPVIDCHFRLPPQVDFGGGHCAPRSSFRNISRDYFRDEAPYHFAAEAALFAAIMLTAGLAIGIGTAAAIDFLRVLGYL
jgi:hypothetical protein